MTLSKLGSLALTGAIAFCCVPACGDDESEDSTFAGASGSSGRGGSGGKGGTTGRGGGAGEAPTSGGSAGEAPASGGGSGSAGDSSLGGSAGSEQGGGTSQGGGAGEGGSDNPTVGWYCNISVSGCVCVQEPLEVGDCGVFNCCYTYDGGPAGLACACNDALDAACDAAVASNDGTRVDFCPP